MPLGQQLAALVLVQFLMWGSGAWHLLGGGSQPERVEGSEASGSRRTARAVGPLDLAAAGRSRTLAAKFVR